MKSSGRRKLELALILALLAASQFALITSLVEIQVAQREFGQFYRADETQEQIVTSPEYLEYWAGWDPYPVLQDHTIHCFLAPPYHEYSNWTVLKVEFDSEWTKIMQYSFQNTTITDREPIDGNQTCSFYGFGWNGSTYFTIQSYYRPGLLGKHEQFLLGFSPDQGLVLNQSLEIPAALIDQPYELSYLVRFLEGTNGSSVWIREEYDFIGDSEWYTENLTKYSPSLGRLETKSIEDLRRPINIDEHGTIWFSSQRILSNKPNSFRYLYPNLYSFLKNSKVQEIPHYLSNEKNKTSAVYLIPSTYNLENYWIFQNGSTLKYSAEIENEPFLGRLEAINRYWITEKSVIYPVYARISQFTHFWGIFVYPLHEIEIDKIGILYGCLGSFLGVISLLLRWKFRRKKSGEEGFEEKIQEDKKD